MDNAKVKGLLFSMAEEEYKKFNSSLIPGAKNMIGVRIPKIHKLAKKIARDNADEFLDSASDYYFEEIMLQGFVIGEMRGDINKIASRIKQFISKIDNWSVCDSFCTHLKIVRDNKDFFWNFIKHYYSSSKTYYIRFAVVIILLYYIEDKYLQDIFEIFSSITSEDYYVKMAVAWAVSMCFVKYQDETLCYIKSNRLDADTHNKAIKKITESLKVDKETKKKIRLLKRI